MTREEAINIYQGLINPRIKEAFEFFVPELRESEDERIRKALICHLKAGGDFKADGVTKEEMISYLEKQKERGPLTKDEEYTLHRIIEYLEDETCPSEWISLLHDIYCLPYAKQEEQKPAEWSEEDEKVYQYLKAVFEYSGNRLNDQEHIRPGLTIGMYRSFIDKLKSLRPRWKPSEEQMRSLIDALRVSLSEPDMRIPYEPHETYMSQPDTF